MYKRISKLFWKQIYKFTINYIAILALHFNQNFVTDLSATGVRVKEINDEAERMVKRGHSQARKIRTRQQQLNDKWEGLQTLKASKDQSLSLAQK